MLDGAGCERGTERRGGRAQGHPPRTGARLLRPAVVIEMLRRRAPSRGP